MEDKPTVGHHYDCNHSCGFFEGYKDYKERKEKEKKDNRKAVIDEMNEALQHEITNCFGGIQ